MSLNNDLLDYGFSQTIISQENKTKDKMKLLLKPSKNQDTSYYTSLNASDQSNRFTGMA